MSDKYKLALTALRERYISKEPNALTQSQIGKDIAYLFEVLDAKDAKYARLLRAAKEIKSTFNYMTEGEKKFFDFSGLFEALKELEGGA